MKKIICDISIYNEDRGLLCMGSHNLIKTSTEGSSSNPSYLPSTYRAAATVKYGVS